MTRNEKELENLLLAEMRRLDDPYRLWDQPDDGLPIPETRNPDPKEKSHNARKTGSALFLPESSFYQCTLSRVPKHWPRWHQQSAHRVQRSCN